MNTAPKTRLAKLAAAALAVGVMFPVVAGAVVLPQEGPIPAPRPTLVAVEAIEAPVVAPQREVIHISSAAQDIPDARRDVRVVGMNFLPDASEEIDFSGSDEQQMAAVGYAEWFVQATITRMFETSGGDEELQVASN